MLQAHPIGARTLDAAALDAAGAGARPDHVDALLWQLASPVERELLRFVAGQGAATQAATPSTAFPAGTIGNAAGARTSAANDAAATPATTTSTSREQAALVKITDQFRARFSDAAKDPATFNTMLKTAFGDKYDAAAAEGLRQQALRNDFSWMPKVEVVDGAQLADQSGTQAEGAGRGAYAKDGDTIYLSRELLLSDPASAERVLTEEVGHAIDARINTHDAVGDEGDIFSALLHGDSVSDAQVQAMRADNDHGTITVNGRQVEVEYGWLKKAFKKVTNAVKSVGNFVANTAKAAVNVGIGLATFDFQRVKQGVEDGFDAAKQLAKDTIQQIKDTWNDIKSEFKKLMASKLFNAILMVARFIPIPIVQLVVRVIDIVKAAYSVYQGVKNKSWGAVVGGVASLAGGVAGVAGKFGASVSTVNTIKTFADTAQKVSMAYNAASSKNFAQAALLAGQAFAPSNTTLIDTLKTAATVENVVKSVENKDYGAAVAGVGTLAGGQLGKAVGVDEGTAKGIANAAKTVDKIGAVVKAVEKKDYGTVLAGAVALGGASIAKAVDFKPDDKTVDTVKDLAKTAQQVAAVVKAVRKDDYGAAILQAGALAGGPAGRVLDIGADTAKAIVTTGRAAQQVQSLVTAVERNDATGAVRQGAALLGLERQDHFPDDPKPKSPAKPAAPAVTLSDVWTQWEAAQARP